MRIRVLSSPINFARLHDVRASRRPLTPTPGPTFRNPVDEYLTLLPPGGSRFPSAQQVEQSRLS